MSFPFLPLSHGVLMVLWQALQENQRFVGMGLCVNSVDSMEIIIVIGCMGSVEMP